MNKILQYEITGQLTVYNFKGGPTYRCLYPEPPPPSAVTNCSDGGVLGAVPGVIGCLQARTTFEKIISVLRKTFQNNTRSRIYIDITRSAERSQ